MFSDVGNWLYHIFGIKGTGAAYSFWSGAGSDWGQVTVLGGAVLLYRKHNCHERRCWRIGKHPIDGSPYIVCRKHHPDVPNKGATHEHIVAAHQAGKDARGVAR
jgi:hypothetical protein